MNKETGSSGLNPNEAGSPVSVIDLDSRATNYGGDLPERHRRGGAPRASKANARKPVQRWWGGHRNGGVSKLSKFDNLFAGACRSALGLIGGKGAQSAVTARRGSLPSYGSGAAASPVSLSIKHELLCGLRRPRQVRSK